MDNKLLIIDDEQDIIDALTRSLKDFPADVEAVRHPREALEIVRRTKPQVVLSDLKMPEMDGLQLLTEIKNIHSSTQVILITGYGSIEDAVEAMRRGAYDFVAKPFKRQEIWATLMRAFEKVELLEENSSLKEKLKGMTGLNLVWGSSEIFRNLLERSQRAAKSRATILIQGESGTGKEVLANFIVKSSDVADKKFIKVNCAAIPENLIESELFGHKRGAFTGAFTDKEGKFSEADGGTLFLDEVGEIPLSLQPKLLRALQEGEIHPVGGREKKVHVRIIAATNRDLRKAVKEGIFREDLFYRLYVIPLTLPPLRTRIEDLATLAAHFLVKHGRKVDKANISLSKEALFHMERYPWPGNIRELENALERAVVLSQGNVIQLDDLPSEIREAPASSGQETLALPTGLTLEQMELRILQIYLRKNHGDKAKTAEELGVSLRTIYRKMEAVELEAQKTG